MTENIANITNEITLETKLEVPSMVSKILRRTRLTSLIQQTGDRRVTLINAPAGYGKTTLLGEWQALSSSYNQRTAWITLDQFDNAPFRFWFYLVEAIRNVFPTLKYQVETQLSNGDQHSLTGLIPLINEINSLPFILNIILDDFQVIKDPVISAGLVYLIEHQPKNLHLIIASRTRPDIPLSRLRMQNRLVEITAEDLSFSFEETCSFLNDSIKRQLTSNEIVRIFETTEGWIAGLKMSAITFQSRTEGDHIYFTDIQNNLIFREFFLEEVLINLLPDLQEFLLASSLLTEFSSGLCDCLFELNNSQKLIEQLVDNNLFIESIDNQGQWFRYHPLFARALNQQMRKKRPADIIPIHQKALTWFIENGYPEKAVIHALQSGHQEQAAEIIDSLALQAAIDFDLIKLVHWINAIPDNLIALRPRLGVYNALACFLLGQYDITNIRLREVEDLLYSSSILKTDQIEYDVLKWEISVIRTGIEIMAGSTKKGYAEISGLLDDKTKETNYIYAMFTHFRARSLEKMGRLQEALEDYKLACKFGLARDYHIGYFHSRIGLIQVLLRQGQIIKAKQECEQVINYILENKLDSATYNMALSVQLEIALQLNYMSEADRIAEIVLTNFENTIKSESVIYNHIERCVYLTNYLVRTKKLKTARQYFDRALSCHQEYSLPGSPIPGVIIDSFVRLTISEACQNKNLDWQQSAIEFLDDSNRKTPSGKLAQASIYLNQKAYQKAKDFLVCLVEDLRKTECEGYLLQAMILLAIALYYNHERDSSFVYLEESLSVGYRTGARRIFLEQGDSLMSLVTEFSKSELGKRFEDKIPGFLDGLNYDLDQECKMKGNTISKSEPSMTGIHLLKEPLSDRENEILQMLIVGKTGKEISDLLMVSINTTKTHIQSIYRKFDIHSQRMLIAKAKELDLIKSL